VPDTVLDLCEGGTPRVLEDLLTRAMQKHLTTPVHLQRALDRRHRHSRPVGREIGVHLTGQTRSDPRR
jgi:hypothetical protein